VIRLGGFLAQTKNGYGSRDKRERFGHHGGRIIGGCMASCWPTFTLNSRSVHYNSQNLYFASFDKCPP
jgi:hypothetical protein